MPHIVHGSSDQARYAYAERVARNNEYNFVALNAEEAEATPRQFLSSTLDDTTSLFYISDAEKLGESFLAGIASSPHKIILSVSKLYDLSPQTRSACLHIKIGSPIDLVNDAIKAIMTIDDRNSVRLALQLVKPDFLFHIMKKGAWRDIEALQAMIEISRNLYKVRTAYLYSMLAYALPKKVFATYAQKSRVDPMQIKILKKISKVYKYNSSQVADLYLLFQAAHAVPEEVSLTDEEKAFMGATAQAMHMQVDTFAKAVDLTEFF